MSNEARGRFQSFHLESYEDALANIAFNEPD